MKAIDKIGSAFLRRVLRRMKELGMSQTDLAKRMKVSRPYITKVLHQDVNQMIMNAPPPDHTVLNRDAEIFAKWIARIHKKERARMNASSKERA